MIGLVRKVWDVFKVCRVGGSWLEGGKRFCVYGRACVRVGGGVSGGRHARLNGEEVEEVDCFRYLGSSHSGHKS